MSVKPRAANPLRAMAGRGLHKRPGALTSTKCLHTAQFGSYGRDSRNAANVELVD